MSDPFKKGYLLAAVNLNVGPVFGETGAVTCSMPIGQSDGETTVGLLVADPVPEFVISFITTVVDKAVVPPCEAPDEFTTSKVLLID